MTGVLPRQRLWNGIGWALLAAVVVLSLVSIPQAAPLPGSDKTHHLVAYGTLMYWWGMVQPKHRWRWLIVLPLMGVALEGLQSLNPDRFMEWWDAAANLAGVLLGALLVSTPAGRLLAWIDR